MPDVFRSMICALLLATAAAFAAEPAPRVAPEPFFKHADYGYLRMSPSGKYIGGLVPARGRRSLAVLDVAANQATPVATVEGRDIGTFEWVNDDRIVFTVADLQAGLGEDRGGGLFAINRDGSDFRELAPTLKKQIDQGRFVGRYTGLLTTLPDGSDDVLVVANESDPATAMFIG